MWWCVWWFVWWCGDGCGGGVVVIVALVVWWCGDDGCGTPWNDVGAGGGSVGVGGMLIVVVGTMM